VLVLDRPRHADLIEEIRRAGARVLLIFDGDTAGALLAASPDTPGDVLMGIGGVPEGVTAACAVQALRGAMLGRLAPQSQEERQAIAAAGLNLNKILTGEELVASTQIFLATTGITPGPLLQGVQYRANQAKTHSLLIRCETGTRRMIQAEHIIGED
jgi:fructose-1,6-bisphosphatase II